MRADPSRHWPLRFAGGAALLLAGAVWAGADAWLLRAVHGTGAEPAGPLWLRTTALNISALGSLAVLALVVAGTGGFLWLRRQPRIAAALLLSAALAEAASELLKLLTHRARPPFAAALTTYGASFPSAHAMLSATVYLTLGAILARAEAHRPTRRYVLALATLLAVLIGSTRVYLGVHWPTDVLAGWTLGGLWAAGTAEVIRRMQVAGGAEGPV